MALQNDYCSHCITVCKVSYSLAKATAWVQAWAAILAALGN
jgi:hypothetical protein